MTYKVFVGNLSFKTKAEELAAEFSAAGKVVGANIIARGPRSLGYGFVEMETEEDAHKAVALLNKKSIDNREINVEVAKPRDDSRVAERRQAPEGGDQQQGGAAPRRGGRGGRGGRGRGGRGRGGRGGRGGRAPRAEVGTAGEATPVNQGENNNDNNNSNNNNEGANQAPPRRRYRGRSRSGGNAGAQGGDAAAAPRGGRGGGRGGRGRGGRFPRPPREADNRTPSPTTLFVANLPFSLNDEGLLELFKAQNPTKAHVVLNRNGRSKGFGFVEFANEQDQQAAVNAEKKTVESRELIVKVALTSDQKPEGQAPEAEKTAEVKEEPKTN